MVGGERTALWATGAGRDVRERTRMVNRIHSQLHNVGLHLERGRYPVPSVVDSGASSSAPSVTVMSLAFSGSPAMTAMITEVSVTIRTGP